jgi:hypothetical protein
LVGGIISNANPAGATTIDAKGGYLMRQYGVTTALDMGTYPYSSVTACRVAGLTDVYGPGAAGTVNRTTISHLPGFPSDSFIPNVAAGQKFVADRVAQGVDYIKVILDPLGPDNETLAAIVQASHAAGKLVITHAPSYADYSQAEMAGADLPCHVPLDKPLDAISVGKLTSAKTRVTPTLIMMQSVVNNTCQPYSHYTVNAEGSVTNIYNGGVPILVGSDANISPYVPANPPFGVSLHEELELLVAAGVSPVKPLEAPHRLPRRPIGSMTVARLQLACGLTLSFSAPIPPLISGIHGQLRGSGSVALRLTPHLDSVDGAERFAESYGSVFFGKVSSQVKVCIWNEVYADAHEEPVVCKI